MNSNLKANQVFSTLVIGAIAALFALQWGPGSKGCETDFSLKKEEAAATVNGRVISVRDFRRAYGNQLAALRSQGSPIDDQLARQLGFHTRVLESMVDEELLAQAAKANGVQASDDDLREVLSKNPDFQKDGHFDLQRYREVLRDYYQRTDVEYEAELRRRISAQKLIESVEATAMVSDDEVRSRFLKEGNRANAVFARFLPTMFAAKVVQPKPADISAWAASHAKEISDYYAANSYLYHQPERMKLRHILVKVAKDAPAPAKDAAKSKLAELRKQIEGGKDFAEAAKEVSEDTGTKAMGGDLGFAERGSFDAAFSEAAFGLKPGEVSQPVETRQGFHLIKAEEKRAPETKELKTVELEIAKQLMVKELAQQLAQKEAQKALAAVKAGKKLTELFPPSKEAQANAMRFEAEAKPEAVEAGEFDATAENLPQLGSVPELIKEIFALEKPQTIDRVIPNGEGYAVVVVTDRKRANPADFDAQKEKLRKEALTAKRFELREAYLKALKASGQVVTHEKAIELSSPARS